MSGGFSNPLVGGGGGLVYPSIHSPNYVPATTGWSVNKDGSAQFAGLDITGGSVVLGTSGGGLFVYNGTPGPSNPPVASIVPPGVTQDPYGSAVSAVIQVGAQFGGNPYTQIDQFGNIKLFSSGGDVIIQQSPGNDALFVYEDDFGTQGPLLVSIAGKAGTDPNTGTPYPKGLKVFQGLIEGTNAFFYSPSPAFGNLAQSVTNADGTDDFGNAFIAGTATYANNGTFWSAVVVANGVINWYKASSEAGPWTAQAGIGFSFNNITGGGLTLTAPAGLSGALNTPQTLSGSVQPLPADGNSGTTWVAGERAFMNNSWVAKINSNFSAIVAALQAAGIAT